MVRRTGRTTRIIDVCVQDLYKHGAAYFYDGPVINGIRRQEYATPTLDRMRTRLYLEHNVNDLRAEWGEFFGKKCYKVTIDTQGAPWHDLKEH